MKQKPGRPNARKTAGPQVYVLFVRELDGLTCGVRCPPWADVRELGHLPLPVSGLYTGETLTPHEWATLCAAWGETLLVYGWQKAGLIE